LGRWQIIGQLYCLMVVGLALFAPLSVILYWLINGLQQGEQIRDLLAPLQGSMRAAALAAFACGILSLPLVVLQVRYPRWPNQVIARAAYLGYALPGVVIALSLVFFGANYLIKWFDLESYRLLSILIFAYVVRFLPQALGPARAALLQVNPHLEESALTLGRSPLRIFGGITLPLMRSGVMAGMALVFLTAIKELPTTLLLAPPDYDTLAVRIWSASSEAFYARAAAPALLLVIISGLSLVFILDADEERPGM
jgi:iron(III) transport system permease protein